MSEDAVVERWEEVAPGVWLPAHISVVDCALKGGKLERYAVRSIPETFLIGKDGLVVAHGTLDQILSKVAELRSP
ncbi:MAG: hypothetical protein HYX69_16125 [Planctomycetia bacterium]|nr:hypothetical protein [Planctomycetia bacterium]